MSAVLGVAASWVAAAISLASAAFVFWKFWYEREQADWAAEPLKALFNVKLALARNPYATIKVPGTDEQILQSFVNVGEALNIQATSSDCLVVFLDKNTDDPRGVSVKLREARVPSGAAMTLAIFPATSAASKFAPGKTMKNAPQEKPERICLTLEWTQRPTWRHKRCSQTFELDGELFVPVRNN